MVLPRSSNCSSIFRVQGCRTARAVGQSWRQTGRQAGRRSYASGHHEGAKKASSDLPWLIGSVAVTVPSATWLWQQGPKKSDHHGDHGHSKHEEHDEGQGQEGHDEEEGTGETDEKAEETLEQKSDDTEEPSGESGKEGGNDEETEGKEAKRPVGENIRNEPPNEVTSSDNKWISGDEVLEEGGNDSVNKKSQHRKTVDPDADEGNKVGPSDKVDKGHEGEEKGTRITEEDKERKAEDPVSNSLHPYMADERESKKGEGVVDTAKITGTVDINRKLR